MRATSAIHNSGDTGRHRLQWYSRGIRQRLAKLAAEGKWRERHKIYIGERHEVPGDYSELIRRSKFCLVAPGEGGRRGRLA